MSKIFGFDAHAILNILHENYQSISLTKSGDNLEWTLKGVNNQGEHIEITGVLTKILFESFSPYRDDAAQKRCDFWAKMGFSEPPKGEICTQTN